ncbi:MAG TPA: S41 family peptidase [Bacteroidia bacterium]|nr:S41 family peptidase [Bacteroidia bacterium]
MLFSRPFSFFIFCFLGFTLQLQSQHKSVLTRKYAPAELQTDAKIFRDVIFAMHPAIGIYKSKEFYTQLFDTYISSLTDSLTERDFRLKSKLVAEELRCGHTEVIYSSEYYKTMNRQKLNFSPYIFLPVQNKVYVIANLDKKSDSTLKKGTEILKINGIGVDSMQRYCKRFISADGYNTTAQNHYLQLGFNSYYTALFGRPDTFSVEYKEGSETKNLRYAAFKPKLIPPIPLGMRDDSLFTRYKRAKIKYRFLEPEKTSMLLKLEKFSRKKTDKAYRRIFRRLKKNKTENLILDLRNNGGGSIENSYRLLSYLIDKPQTQTLRTSIKSYPYRQYTRGNVLFKLTKFAFKIIAKKVVKNDTDYFVYTIKPRKKNHFDKNLYVLINGGSFSASCLVGAYLKHRGKTVFIGEETGGAIEGCNAGITPYYKLPNSKIKVRVPAFRIIHDVNPTITGHGIMPDYPIEYNIKDIMGRRDLELLKVKDLIKERGR